MNKNSVSNSTESATIPYRFYRRATDNMGKALAAADWPAFVAALRQALTASAPSKEGLPAIGPYTLLAGAKRGTAGVHRVTIAALDIDGGLPDVRKLLAEIRHYGLAAVVHTSPSDAGDGAPSRKVRVYLPLSRPLEPRECALLRRVLGESFGVAVDPNTLDPSRVFFAGAIDGTPPREVWEIEGDPVPVDDVLAIAPVPEPTKAREATAATDPTPGDPAIVEPLIAALADALLPAWQTGNRQGWLLECMGWLAGKCWAREEREAVIEALLDREPPDPDKGRKYRAMAARAKPLDGPAPGVREALGDSFDAVDAVVQRHPGLPHNRMVARRAKRAANDANAQTEDMPMPGRDPVVDLVIRAIAEPEYGIYQRAGILVRLTREAHDDRGIVRAAGVPTIRKLPVLRLCEIIDAAGQNPKTGSTIEARGEWDHIRPLDAIVTYPVMRRDGSLLLESGYDSPTRTLAQISIAVDVPEQPTQADARAALALLSDLVSDFPFAGDAHRSGWLSALLTPLARPAITGATPMLLLEASARGSGKTLLADLIGVIVTGNATPRRVAPKTKEEWDKSLFAMLLAGDPIMLLDNVTNMLVSDALDAILTTEDRYSQRVLGVSEERSVAVRTMIMASSNNARLSTDLVRRTLLCRLEPGVERPEQRTAFAHPDILGHVRANRVQYLSAALTILRAYAAEGRPAVETRTMGSYGSWCRTVRDALVWAGAVDPAPTQDILRETADVEGDEISDVLHAWHALLGEQALSLRDLLQAAQTGRAPSVAAPKTGNMRERMAPDPKAPAADMALLEALRGVMPDGAEPTAQKLGNRLRTMRDQIAGGLVLRAERADTHSHHRGTPKRWRVARLG